MRSEERPRFTDCAAWLCCGNADERFTTLALENLLAELASVGRSPLAVYSDSPPFSAPPVRFDSRDHLDRHLEHFTRAAIPAIRQGALEELLHTGRTRERLRAEGSRFGSVLIRSASMPAEGVPVVADGIILLVAMNASTPGWVYHAARTLSAAAKDLPVLIVVLNAAHLEGAAVFYQETRDEVAGLLGKDVGFCFAGSLKFDPDYVSASLKARQPLVTCFPGSPLHGQVKYVLRAMSRAIPTPPAESFFHRVASPASSR